jgi:nitric oxide dioxygenase
MILSPALNLSSKQRQLIRDSFESVREYEVSVLMLFYGRMFEIAPETRRLFQIDMQTQSHKLMDALSVVILGLDRFEELVPYLTELGRKHVDNGAQPYQYERLRTALLWAFGQALGLEFDRGTKLAWQQSAGIDLDRDAAKRVLDARVRDLTIRSALYSRRRSTFLSLVRLAGRLFLR